MLLIPLFLKSFIEITNLLNLSYYHILFHYIKPLRSSITLLYLDDIILLKY
jgi:hypothetical protein